MFSFNQKTQVIFGENALAELPGELKRRNIDKLLLVSDPGIEKAGILAKVADTLHQAGAAFHAYTEIEVNPSDTTMTKGAEECKATGCDGVLGVGGGSPIDSAKVIAMLATNAEPLEHYIGKGADAWANAPLPILAIPTAAGTGAEVSGASMINLIEERRKVDIFGLSITPDTAICDPVLTVGLPPHLTATTGVDALTHAIESYVCNAANPVSDMFAVRAIELIANNIKPAFADGTNIAARSAMLLASSLAIIGYAGLGCVHSVAQTIGGYYNLPHGLSVSVCLPTCSEFNISTVPEKYAHIARIFGVDTGSMSLSEAARSAIMAFRQLLADLEVSDTLASLGVQTADVDTLAKQCMLDGSTPPNPRPLSEENFRELILKLLQE